MIETKWGGILPAVVTPMDEDGRFLPAAFERLCEFLYRAGVHGLYVCGQTGEGFQQTVEQRKAVAEAAVKLSPAGAQVIVHVGAARTADAAALAAHAERIGATAISSLPPAGSYGFDEVLAYYQAVAASTSLPLLVYYFPRFAAHPSTLQHLETLCAIPNVAGLKFTDSDFYRLSELKRTGAIVYNGYDEMLVAGLLMGADGGIGSFYNVIPGWFVALFEDAKAGRWEQARQRQAAINQIISIGLRYPVNAAVKHMLTWMGLDCGVCALPRRRLSLAEKSELDSAMERTPASSIRQSIARAV